MGIVVQKYGGSSVADTDKLERVAEKVVATRAEGHEVVVVVSAMGKTTDELLTLARRIDPTPPRRELDMLLTTGERVSMALLSMAIQKRGLVAISFTGSQSGIITNDRHFDARIIEVRPHRVEDELARGRVVIVAGYQGMSYKREITTLGRGGSDTTALAMAAALEAERAEIYSDVDGVYSADPRVVEDAHHLPEIGYEEMQEMAEAGAKVLHTGAVEFAKKAEIPIHARSAFTPGKETIVHGAAGGTDAPRAVVGQRGVVRVCVQGGTQALGEALSVTGTRARDVKRDGDTVRFEVFTQHAPDWDKTRSQLFERLGEAVTLEEGLAGVSAVGQALERDRARGEAVLAALGDASIPHRGIIRAPLRMTALVDEAALDDGVRAVHRRLIP